MGQGRGGRCIELVLLYYQARARYKGARGPRGLDWIELPWRGGCFLDIVNCKIPNLF